eukprot:385378_1
MDDNYNENNKQEWDYIDKLYDNHSEYNAETYDNENITDHDTWDDSLNNNQSYAARDEPIEYINNSMDKTIRHCDTLKFIRQNSNETEMTDKTKLLKNVSSSYSPKSTSK